MWRREGLAGEGAFGWHVVRNGAYTVWCAIAAPGYLPVTNSAAVSISPRTVTLTSGDASKTYDGLPVTCADIHVGGFTVEYTVGTTVGRDVPVAPGCIMRVRKSVAFAASSVCRGRAPRSRSRIFTWRNVKTAMSPFIYQGSAIFCPKNWGISNMCPF